MTKKLGITISPPNRLDNWKSYNIYKDRYLEDSLLINFILRKYKIPSYIIYPEIDPKGRLHYHGIINLNSHQEVSFYKCVKSKLSKLGYVDISLLKDFQSTLRWTMYMAKDWGKTKEIIDIIHPLLPFKKPKATSVQTTSLKEDLDKITHYFSVIEEYQI